MRADQDRIAELEREIYGQVLTVTPRQVEPWRGDGAELDAAVRDVVRWVLSVRPDPQRSGRVMTGGRLLVQCLLVFLVVWVVLAVAGVVS